MTETERKLELVTIAVTEKKSDNLYSDYWHGKITEQQYMDKLEELRTDAYMMIESFEVYELISREAEKRFRQWADLIISV